MPMPLRHLVTHRTKHRHQRSLLLVIFHGSATGKRDSHWPANFSRRRATSNETCSGSLPVACQRSVGGCATTAGGWRPVSVFMQERYCSEADKTNGAQLAPPPEYLAQRAGRGQDPAQ